jgi:hypothetical protein
VVVSTGCIVVIDASAVVGKWASCQLQPAANGKPLVMLCFGCSEQAGYGGKFGCS